MIKVFGKRNGPPAPRPTSEWTERFVARSLESAAAARRIGEEDLALRFEEQAKRAHSIEARFA